jgi:hypothetical protein
MNSTTNGYFDRMVHDLDFLSREIIMCLTKEQSDDRTAVGSRTGRIVRDASDLEGCFRVACYTLVIWALIIVFVLLYVSSCRAEATCYRNTAGDPCAETTPEESEREYLNSVREYLRLDREYRRLELELDRLQERPSRPPNIIINNNIETPRRRMTICYGFGKDMVVCQ